MVASKRAYGLTTPFVSVFPDPITKNAAPTASDKNYPNGFVWIYKNGDTRTSYMYGGLDSNGDAVWILAGPGASDVDTISGDTGTATPSSGNINIVGGTNITTTGASPTGDDVSVSLDDAIALATSVTSPLYTTGAGTDLLLTGASGQNVVMKLGDDAGATKFSITDSADSEVFAVNSSGTFTSGVTVNVTAVNDAASPYTVLGSDYVIAADTSGGAVTITLPASPATGRTVVVVDEGGAAGASNITIGGNGNNIAAAGTVASSKAIDSNYGTMTLYFTGTIWNAQDIA